MTIIADGGLFVRSGDHCCLQSSLSFAPAAPPLRPLVGPPTRRRATGGTSSDPYMIQ